METIFITLIVIVLALILISEKYNVTFLGAMNIWAMLLHSFIKQLLAPPKIYLPTAIGYDTNGCFCPDAVEKEFKDLNIILDGLYLSNHRLINDDIWGYAFKYARVVNDIDGIELYDYIDKKTLQIVQQHLHKIGNLNANDNISSIILNDDELIVYMARTAEGEQKNAALRNYQRQIILEKNNQHKINKGSITVDWKD